MIAMIGKLIEKDYAYVAGNGDVMYAVSRFGPYGRLSGKRLADLRAGSRVQVDEAKRDPLDFVLWKMAKPGEPSWPSPWGEGRPGWHIECSAMAEQLLGTHFDIHGGGLDLKFPHHENEIAQSCAASGDKFANLWMHNGFLNVDNEKMAKSLGNFFTIREVLRQVRDPEVIRYFVLSSHYRGPINYTEQSLRQADAALERIYLALREAPATDEEAVAGEATARFRAAMDDDFNTPEALAVLQGLAKEINIAMAGGEPARAAALAAELRGLGAVLGVVTRDAEGFLRESSARALPGSGELRAPVATLSGSGVAGNERIDELVGQREAARKEKNWQESDRIRDELAQEGVILEDKPGGQTVWRRRLSSE
jgi:cysteinyl-tRNA synthetase